MNEALILERLEGVRLEAQRVRRRVPRTVRVEDLVSAGTVGLVQAAETFDPEMGTKFRTHAERRVRGAMLDYLRGEDWAPRGARKREAVPDVGGLEAAEGAAWGGVGPLEAAERKEGAEAVRSLLGPLSPRTRMAIVAYHGYGHTLREIGATLGVSESAVCQLVQRGLGHLRRDKRAADVARGGDLVA